MEHGAAFFIADELLRTLRPSCERIEIAGSIRRAKKEVKDIELIAIPLFMPDLFGETLLDHSLDVFDWASVGDLKAGGHKMKKVALHAGINLDLFIVTPPAQWGVQMVIRTGPAEFSQWMVTKKSIGGALPDHCFVKDGAVWDGRDGSKFNLPEEKDFFRLCGLNWLEPALREARWKR